MLPPRRVTEVPPPGSMHVHRCLQASHIHHSFTHINTHVYKRKAVRKSKRASKQGGGGGAEVAVMNLRKPHPAAAAAAAA